jgi:hypothetical protein
MKTLITIMVAVAVLTMCVPAQAILLSELLQGATIVSGDKLFSDFHSWTTTSTEDPVNPADITVSEYQNPTNLEYGLKFTSDALKLESMGGLEVNFDFIVTPTRPNYLISDNTLTMAASGWGNIFLAETASDAADESVQLAYKYNVIQGGGTFQILTDHQVYTVPVQSVHVHKYIQIDWAGDDTAPQLTEFTQTFSQVPEPATLAILGLGGLLFARKK